MNQDESVQVDHNTISCHSDLAASFDWNSLNQCKEKGDYLLVNLLEIHLTFHHYRCESFSNYTQSSFSTHSLNFANKSSYHQQSSKSLLFKDSISSTCLQAIQSVPPSAETDSNLAPHKTDIACPGPTIPVPFNHSQKRSKLKSSKDLHNLLRAFTRLKRYNPSSVGNKLNCFRSTKSFNKPAISNTANISDNLYNKRTSIRNHLQTIKSKPLSKTEIVHCHQQVGNLVNCINKPTSDLIPENTEDLKSDHNSQIVECDTPSLVDGTVIPIKCNSSVSDHNLVQAQIVHTQDSNRFLTSSSFVNVPLKSPLCYNLVEPVVSSKCKFSETDLCQFPVIVSASCSNTSDNRPNNLKDYCSLSEYSLTRSNIRHYINADVCSLPNCINDELSSKMLENKSSVSSQHRMPSYVNISRAISGYANYNKYSSEVNRDDSYLNSLIFTPNSDHSLSSPISRRQLNTSDEVDNNFSSLPYEPSHEKILLNQNDKSFLQRKIECLYGESFAENWKKSRPKSRSPKSESTLNKTRSPSCPPRNHSVDSDNVLNADKHLNKNKSLDCTDNVIQPKFDHGVEEEKLKSLHIKPSSSEEATPNLNETSDSMKKKSSHQDAHWFLAQLNNQSIEIQCKIDKCQEYLQDAESIPEETAGKIRATIGKANLLLNKKFQQFEKLCRDSLIQQDDEEFKIKCDDLGGFWDMVLIQVEDIIFSFNELEQLKKNDWKLDELDSIQNTSTFQSSKRVVPNSTDLKNNLQRSKLASPKSSPSKDKKDSPNGLCREAERKNRLMEIKRKGKLKALESTDEEIAIFAPTSDSDINQV